MDPEPVGLGRSQLASLLLGLDPSLLALSFFASVTLPHVASFDFAKEGG